MSATSDNNNSYYIMKKNHAWQGVPPEKADAWHRIFDASHEGINLATACPVCGTPTLHRYYQVGRPGERAIEGKHFIALGASWEWCSTCYSYEHATALVPTWWSEQLPINEQELTAEPDVLEEAVQRYFTNQDVQPDGTVKQAPKP